MADWILLPLLCRPEAAPLRELAGADAAAVTVSNAPWRVEVHNGYDFAPSERAAEERAGGDCPRAPLDTAALEWRYPYEPETTLSAKRPRRSSRVARLTRRSRRTPRCLPACGASQSRRFLEGAAAAYARRAGHRDARGAAVSRFLDAGGGRCGARAVKSMEERRLLTPEQARAVDARRADAVSAKPTVRAHPRGRGAARREYRFSLLESAARFVPEASAGDEILLQGVVDCFFEEDGALVVVDFKTDRIAPGRARRARGALPAAARGVLTRTRAGTESP